MLTPRGWWFFVLVLILSLLTVSASTRGNMSLSIMSLALLVWFAQEWLSLALRVHLALPKLEIRREIRDGERPAELLWLGRPVEVRVRVTNRSWVTLSHVMLDEALPVSASNVIGDIRQDAILKPGESTEFVYRLRLTTVGEARFEGLRIQIVDAQGFFLHDTFRRDGAAVRPVLPALLDAERDWRTEKRFNMLPPPGLHRLRRPGGGSELLDLRDYRPGDPPKMIAWKPSARRDKLITKEFESEVPVRCTIFLDVGQATRLGTPGRNALARMVEITSAVAQASLANRDLVGLCIYDEQSAKWLPAARSRSQMIGILKQLAFAARAQPAASISDVDSLTPLAIVLAREVYPDLLRLDLNRTPLAMHWRPILDSTWGWVALALMLPFGTTLLAFLAVLAGWLPEANNSSQSLISWLFTFAPAALMGLAFWLFYALWGFLPHNIRATTRRKQMATILAHRNRLGPGGISRLMHDNELFVRQVQEFLAEHHVPYRVRLYDDDGQYLFGGAARIHALTQHLTRAIARGRDNELFVLMADLLESDEHIEPLLAAVRAARARHHDVVIVCPWLPGIPPPPRREGELPRKAVLGADGGNLLELDLQFTTTQRYHKAYARLRREFSRLNVPVVPAEPEESIPLILERLDRLHTPGRVVRH